MNSEMKKDLMAIDDLTDMLPDLIDWAIAFKNDTEMAPEVKP